MPAEYADSSTWCCHGTMAQRMVASVPASAATSAPAQCGHDSPYRYSGDNCSRGVTTARHA